MDNNWYTTENWYAPLETPKADGKEHKKKSPMKVIMGVTSLLLVAAIIVTSLIFGGSGNSGLSLPVRENTNNGRSELPDSDVPGSFREYFDSYFTSVTKDVAEIHIEQAEVPINYEVRITAQPEEQLDFEQLYAKCSKSVVAITGYVDGKEGYYWGTGFVVSSNGIIVTNTHVIDHCDRATVTMYDNTEYEAKLVGADSISDIAVLKIEAKGLIPLQIGDSTLLSVGQQVAAIGNPLGEEFHHTLTNGIVSAIDRGINYNGRTMTLIQTNTALNEGNSGGPLFNMYGQAVGVTNMKMMSAFSNIEGIGFAIPSSTMCTIVNAILQDGEVRGRSSIGITVGTISPDAAERYGIPEGLYISDVSEGSDAEAQGIHAGDILTAVNGIEVKTTDEVAAIKDSCKVGDTMILTIWRDENTMDITVTLMDTNDLYK